MDKIAAIISSPTTLMYAFSCRLLSTHPTGPIFEISKNQNKINVRMKSSPTADIDSMKLNEN